MLEVLAAQTHEGARQVLADFALVLVLRSQRRDLLEPLGVPIRELLFDGAPQPRRLQPGIDRLRRAAEALEGRCLLALAVDHRADDGGQSREQGHETGAVWKGKPASRTQNAEAEKDQQDSLDPAAAPPL